VDRGKQGLKRSVATDAHGVPAAALAAPTNRRDDALLAATLDATAIVTAAAVGPLPEQLTMHLDAAMTISRACRCLPSAAWLARSLPARW
jgi:hypothetical protein